MRCACDDMGYKPFSPGRVFTSRHHALENFWVPTQYSFDLSRFNAKSADFDLVIDAPNKLDIAVSVVASEVTRFVKSRARFLDKGV